MRRFVLVVLHLLLFVRQQLILISMVSHQWRKLGLYDILILIDLNPVVLKKVKFYNKLGFSFFR